MRPSSRWSDAARGEGERGNASVEFLVGAMLLLVPVVYLIVALGTIQGQALGAEAAARHIARAVATAEDPASAERRAAAIRASIIAEYALAGDTVEVTTACRPAGECPAAGALLVVTVTTRAALPLVPAVFGLDRLASVPIEARSVQKVSRFWAEAP